MAQPRSLFLAGLTSALLAVVCCLPAAAQEPTPNKSPEDKFNEKYGTYLELLEGYRAYDADKARKLGDFWEKLEPDHGAVYAMIHLTPLALAPLSQMALTDLAIDAYGHKQGWVGSEHMSVAEQWITYTLAMTSRDPNAPQRRFARNWYLAAICLHFSRGDGPRVKKFIDRALELFPADSDILLAAGSYEDLEYNRDRREHPRRHARTQEDVVELQQEVVRAMRYYREAIRLDANNAEARIRLAFLIHNAMPSHYDEAMTLLKEATAQADKPPLSNLAALYGGLVEEHAGHLDEASRRYRNAVAICPRAQTARLALSHVQLDQDLRQSAQNTLRPMTGPLPQQDNVCEPDPWRLYDFGQAWRFDDQIRLMRRQVREPAEGSRP